jgi:uncharacterized protein YuzE
VRKVDQGGARIGDADHIPADCAAFQILQLIVEIVPIGERLGRRTRLAGDNEQRIGERHLLLDLEDRGRICGVEDGQAQRILDRRERALKDEWRQAAASHAHMHDVIQARVTGLGTKGLEFVDRVFHLVRHVQPA